MVHAYNTRRNISQIVFRSAEDDLADIAPNRQNDCVYTEAREAANKDFGTRDVHKFPFKDVVCAEIIFQEVTDIVILPQKTSFDAAF